MTVFKGVSCLGSTFSYNSNKINQESPIFNRPHLPTKKFIQSLLWSINHFWLVLPNDDSLSNDFPNTRFKLSKTVCVFLGVQPERRENLCTGLPKWCVCLGWMYCTLYNCTCIWGCVCQSVCLQCIFYNNVAAMFIAVYKSLGVHIHTVDELTELNITHYINIYI